MHYLEITELAARIKARDISPLSATRAQLDRIASLDGGLKSYAFLMEEAALAQAAAAEAEIAAGRYRGPLHGVPIAVKDLCWTKGVPTAAGMALYKDYRPARDATVVRRLKDAGAVLLGKLQLTEGAYSDHHPSVTPPKNPWNPADWPGISSSGPGVATAAGLCFRYRWIHSLASRGQWCNGAEADVGTRQSLRSLRACADDGPRRADGAQRCRLRRNAAGDRRQ